MHAHTIPDQSRSRTQVVFSGSAESECPSKKSRSQYRTLICSGRCLRGQQEVQAPTSLAQRSCLAAYVCINIPNTTSSSIEMIVEDIIEEVLSLHGPREC